MESKTYGLWAVCVRERARESERKRDMDGERERQTERDIKREIEIVCERGKKRERKRVVYEREIYIKCLCEREK